MTHHKAGARRAVEQCYVIALSFWGFPSRVVLVSLAVRGSLESETKNERLKQMRLGNPSAELRKLECPRLEQLL